MPSTSKSQQRLMGQAYALKSGSLRAKDLDPRYAAQIKKIAKSMSLGELKKFASTKHKNLPEKVDELQSFDMYVEQVTTTSNVKVKDLIEYLNTLDPDMEVCPDGGWQTEGASPMETIRKSNIFLAMSYGDRSVLEIVR